MRAAAQNPHQVILSYTWVENAVALGKMSGVEGYEVKLEQQDEEDEEEDMADMADMADMEEGEFVDSESEIREVGQAASVLLKRLETGQRRGSWSRTYQTVEVRPISLHPS